MTPAPRRFTHFVEARLRPAVSAPGGMFAVASAIAGAVHRANVRLPDVERYALCFPDLDEEEVRHRGDHIRVYGAGEEAVDSFLEDPAIQGLTQMRVMGRAVRETPDDEPVPLCVRCRVAEKTAGWAERQHRRMQRMMLQRRERGDELRKPPIQLAERLACVERRDDGAPARLHFRLRSASTGQRFSIFVRRAAPGDAISLDAYGLLRVRPDG